MYDELIKSLRQCAEASCAGCKNDLVEIGCRGKLQIEAADAIEELFGETERLRKVVMKLENDLGIYDELPIVYQVDVSKTEKTTRWIPVTERLPEPKFAREWYLVALESGCVKSLAYEKERRTDNLFRPGWHETASPVTHWMPLPEPPKEE